MEEFLSVTGKITNPNIKDVSEHIAISWISCISIGKKRPYYEIKWTHLQNLLPDKRGHVKDL